MHLAKSSKLTYFVAEFRGSKIIQKMTLNTHQRCFTGKRTQETLSIQWNHFENWPFCKGYSKAKWSIVFYLGSELEGAKGIQKRLCNHITVLLCKNGLKKHTYIVWQMTRFWKVAKMAFLLKSMVRRRGQNKNWVWTSKGLKNLMLKRTNLWKVVEMLIFKGKAASIKIFNGRFG